MSAIITFKRAEVPAKPPKWEPCYSCPLAECDDYDPRCAYRQALAVYQYCLRHGKEITPEMKAQYSAAKQNIYGKAFRPQLPRWKHAFRFRWALPGEPMQECMIEAFDRNGAMSTFRYKFGIGRKACAFFECSDIEHRGPDQ